MPGTPDPIEHRLRQLESSLRRAKALATVAVLGLIGVLYDEKGAERGGFSSLADGSVVLGLDAPAGVGAAMSERIGIKVEPDGTAHMMLMDNQTRAVAKLHSDGTGDGGVQVFRWDMAAKRIHVRTLVFDGDRRDSVEFGE